MDSDSGSEDSATCVNGANNSEETRNVTENFLPEKSKELYNKKYDLFIEWCNKNGMENISENIVLVYLSQQAKVCSPSYLWSIYSMLKATIRIKHNIDISVYKKVTAFLKKINVGYQPKKSKTFTKEEVNNFLLNAPDEQYLLKKVALILGICGACRSNELCNMTIYDIEDKGSILIVNVPDTKTNRERVFTVTNGTKQDVDYLYYYRKYLNLRPKTATPRLFINYRNGKFSNQAVGKNTMGKIPMNIAQYLKLPDPILYTGHALRRTSASLLVNAGGTMNQFKRHGAWRSRPTIGSEGYIEESITNKIDIANQIVNQSTSLNYTINSPIPPTHQDQQPSFSEENNPPYSRENLIMQRKLEQEDKVIKKEDDEEVILILGKDSPPIVGNDHPDDSPLSVGSSDEKYVIEKVMSPPYSTPNTLVPLPNRLSCQRTPSTVQSKEDDEMKKLQIELIKHQIYKTKLESRKLELELGIPASDFTIDINEDAYNVVMYN